MKRTMLLMLLLLLPVMAAAEFDAGDRAVVVRCKEYITLRETSSTKGESLARLTLGTVVICQGETRDEFTKVSTGGQTGWVLSSYLDPVTEEELQEVRKFALGSRAVIARCEEYISMRADASRRARVLHRLELGETVTCLGDTEGEFARISAHGLDGWVLSAYLDPVPEEAQGEEIPLTTAQKIPMNLFLTTFSIQSFAYNSVYEQAEATDDTLILFGINYLWYYENDSVEWGEWGDDTTRVSDRKVRDLCQRYLGRAPESLEGSLTHRNGYYYWQETGGHVNGTFSIVRRVYDLGGGRISVTFGSYGGGENWVPEGVCTFTEKQAAANYPSGVPYFGGAVIQTNGNLDDSSGWTLERYFAGAEM